MRRLRRRDTKPEIALRQELHRRGLRFRLQDPSLPGRPDIVLTRARIAVFVDGCFWHGCPDHAVTPKANRAFWIEKIATNQARDQRTDALLIERGWTPLHVWEHENPVDAAERVVAAWRIATGRCPDNGDSPRTTEDV